MLSNLHYFLFICPCLNIIKIIWDRFNYLIKFTVDILIILIVYGTLSLYLFTSVQKKKDPNLDTECIYSFSVRLSVYLFICLSVSATFTLTSVCLCLAFKIAGNNFIYKQKRSKHWTLTQGLQGSIHIVLCCLSMTNAINRLFRLARANESALKMKIQLKLFVQPVQLHTHPDCCSCCWCLAWS